MMKLDINTIKNPINRKYVEKHLRYIEIKGFSAVHRQDTFIRLRKIMNEYIPDKDFMKLTKAECENISIDLQKNLNSWHSIYSYVKTLKKFIRVIFDLKSSESLPKPFDCIEYPKDKSKYKVFRGVDEIITPGQAFESVNKAKSKRDAFMFMVLMDSGLRPHELRKAKRKDIINNEQGNWYIQAPKATKTGFRKVRLILSIPYVVDYLKILPKDPETPLIKLTEERIINIIKQIGGITPYILRHSSASFFSSYLNEMEMCERYGWVLGTKQVRTYVHLSQKQIDDKLDIGLNKTNGKEQQSDLEKIQPKFCINCFSYSNFNEDICRVCKRPLDPAEIKKKEIVNAVKTKASLRLLELNPEEYKRIAMEEGFKLV